MKARQLNTIRKVRKLSLTPIQYHASSGVRFGCVLKKGRKWVIVQYGAGDKARISVEDFQRFATEIV